MENEARSKTLIAPTGSKEREAKQALEAHFEALRTIYRDFPEFPKLMKKLEEIIRRYGENKNLDPRSMQTSDVIWQEDGIVVFKIFAGIISMPEAKPIDHVMKVMFKIGRQLVSYAAMKKTTARLISFRRIQIDDNGIVKFRVYNGNTPMSPPRSVKLPASKRAT